MLSRHWRRAMVDRCWYATGVLRTSRPSSSEHRVQVHGGRKQPCSASSAGIDPERAIFPVHSGSAWRCACPTGFPGGAAKSSVSFGSGLHRGKDEERSSNDKHSVTRALLPVGRALRCSERLQETLACIAQQQTHYSRVLCSCQYVVRHNIIDSTMPVGKQWDGHTAPLQSHVDGCQTGGRGVYGRRWRVIQRLLPVVWLCGLAEARASP
jgi:hypothetical protein